jgi:phosphoglycerol transferase MdoB-like AlkP superfamily enzyme
MSVSSHHPFKVPEKHQQRFDSEDPYGRVIPYTDYALKRFFEKISAMEWFDNTLFVITADHSSGHYAQQFKTSVGLFAVPIILYKPDGSLKGNSDMVAQQIDILPTVLNYLNYDQPYVAFGNDLFNDSTDHYVINFVSGSYQIVSNEYELQFDDDRTFGLYRYKEDPLMEQNLMNDSTWIKESLELNRHRHVDRMSTLRSAKDEHPRRRPLSDDSRAPVD